MVKPILYGADFGFSTRAVKLTAKAMGLELDYKSIDMMKGEHRTEDYGKINPQRTVPTLVDNGKVITDSHAIITYLVDAYGKSNMSLYPVDPYIRAKINSILHFESGTNSPKLSAIGASIRQGATEYSKEAVTPYYTVLDTLEMFLNNNGDYLAGNEMTVADFSVIPTISTMIISDIVEFGKYPKIRAWVDRMAKLPYYEELNGKWAVVMNNFFKSQIEANKAAKK